MPREGISLISSLLHERSCSDHGEEAGAKNQPVLLLVNNRLFSPSSFIVMWSILRQENFKKLTCPLLAATVVVASLQTPCG